MSDDKPISFSSRILSFVSKNRSLLLILFVVFILRIPSLFEPHRYADEEIYLTLGMGLRRGLVFYKDIHDNKPPLLYLVAALAGSVFWLRLILMIAHGLGVIFFWKLSKSIFGKKNRIVAVTTFIFAIFSTLPSLEGNIANGENFMIVPALLGTLLFYRSLTSDELGHWSKFIAIGFLFSMAFLFKVPIIFDFMALLVFWIFLLEDKIDLKGVFKILLSSRFLAVLVGFTLPITISIIYYFFHGAFEPYVRSALMQNIGYLSSWKGGGEGWLQNPLIWRGILVFLSFCGIFFARRRLTRPMRLIGVWTMFSIYGALLSSRPYPHYLLEPLVPLSLIVAFPLKGPGLWNRAVSLVLIIFSIILYFENGFWSYKSVPYYKNFIEYAVGKKGWNQYLEFWGAKRNYEIAEHIKSKTSFHDRIFVWGTEPAIYALSERLPVGRYTVSYHIFDFNAFDETIKAIENEYPKYIIVIEDLDHFNDLKEMIQQQYYLETKYDGAQIYKKL